MTTALSRVTGGQEAAALQDLVGALGQPPTLTQGRPAYPCWLLLAVLAAMIL